MEDRDYWVPQTAALLAFVCGVACLDVGFPRDEWESEELQSLSF